MKRTLLRMVQDVGLRIGADEIDILDENTEARDIRMIIQQTLEEILSRRDWEFMKQQPRTLAARDVGDLQINRLKLPADVSRLSLEYVSYRKPADDRNEVFGKLTYLAPVEFLERAGSPNENEPNVDVLTNPDGVRMLIYNDRAPTVYTSFDEKHLWFDAYDVTYGNGNQPGDAHILADAIPSMDWEDPDALFPIPERMEMLLFNESVSVCAVALRQAADPKAESVARRQYNALRNLEPATTRDEQEINYGRKRNRYR